MKKIIKPIKNITIWIILFSSLSVFYSCEDEVDIFAGGNSVPVIYCLLNPYDTVQYVKISKTYTVEKGTNGIAPNADSLYFSGDIQVSLELWEENEVKETIIFEEYDGIVKDIGNFPYDKNIVYRSFWPIRTESKYIMYIYMKEREIILNAEATTVGDLEIIDPFPIPQRKITLSSGQDYTMRWNLAPDAWIYQTAVSFHYDEITGEDTLAKSFEWVQNVVQPDFQKRDFITTRLNGSKFYQILTNNVEENNAVTRVARNLSFKFFYGGLELRFYVESIRPSTSVLQEKPVFTNFSNAEGIFSSLAIKEVTDIQLSNIMIDSIAYSKISKNLSFVDSKDSLYLK